MSTSEEKDSWVKLVLGFDPEAGQESETIAPGDFETELQTWLRDMLAQAAMLPESDARRRIEDLGREAETSIADGKLGAAQSLLDAMSTALTEARRVARAGTVEAESGHRVEYAKLLLRWREAQTVTRDRLKQLGDTILGDPEVVNDPRFEQVEDAVADFLGAIPEFGVELEHLIDGLDKELDPQARAVQVDKARAEIEKCQSILDGADELAELGAFATEEYGLDDVGDDLRDALIELASTLADV